MLDIFWILRNPKAYLVSLLGGGLMMVGVFYTMFAFQAEGDYTVKAFVGDMAEVLGLPSIPGIYENPGHAALAAEGGMADALPAERDGWVRRGWQAEDGAALILAGEAVDPDVGRRAARVVSEFEEVAHGEMPGVLRTYQRGDERIVMMIRRMPMAGRGIGGMSPAERESAVAKMLALGATPLVVHGVAFTDDSLDKPNGGFERFTTFVASQIMIEVASNTDLAALVKLLSGMDIAGLNRFADVPDPIVSADKGVQVGPGLVAGTAAPVAPQPEVTRGAARAQAPVAVEPEKTPTGVCVRRAGKRVCE